MDDAPQLDGEGISGVRHNVISLARARALAAAFAWAGNGTDAAAQRSPHSTTCSGAIRLSAEPAIALASGESLLKPAGSSSEPQLLSLKPDVSSNSLQASRLWLPAVCVASDGQAAAVEFVAAVSQGIRSAGCGVVDLGEVASGGMAIGIARTNAAGGIYVGQLTGDPRAIGLRFWRQGGRPVSGAALMEQLWEESVRGASRVGTRQGASRRELVGPEYLSHLRPRYHALRPLRFVLQTTCLPVANCLRELLRSVACELIAPEGNVSPERLGNQVVAAGAHFGVWIDGDGGTARVSDERGRPVDSERILLLLAQGALPAHAGAMVACEEGTSQKILAALRDAGLRVMASSPERAAMDAALRQSKAVLGGGPSGRFWFAQPLPMADALTALSELLVVLSQSDRPLSQVVSERCRP